MLRSSLAALWLAVSASAALAGTYESLASSSLPAYSAADPAAPAVTEAKLLASERFWPYQAELVSAHAPLGSARSIPAGTLGVVIRVLPGARVRMDFGRDGLATLPVGATDLVARANAVRSGALAKLAPNLTAAIAPRLLDASAETLRRLRLEDSFERAGFLCVFADPRAPSFAALATQLAPLAAREEVLLVLFPQGAHPDAELLAGLRAAGWRGAFALDHLSEAYTRTLVDGEIATPRLALYSAEGRELFTGDFRGALSPELSGALAQAFPARP